jgi:hypothetical protein
VFKLNKYDVTIDVKLNNGVYIFNHKSATGKTRLAKLLDKYRTYGEPVASYTYSDVQLNKPIKSILKPGKFKLIVLDRYDMYEGLGIGLIDECAKDAIILVDCKGAFSGSGKDDWCKIDMTPSSITVTQ